ncbi:MAG: hypothetical protein BACD_02318 [Bacteroides rodentium]
MEPYQFVYAGHLSGILLLPCFPCKGRLLLGFFDIKMLYFFCTVKNRNASIIYEKNQAKGAVKKVP